MYFLKVILLLSLTCACGAYLHAQETLMWTPVTNASNDVDRYEMHRIDFFSGNSEELLFSIAAERFTHANMTGLDNLIRSFEYTSDKKQVYFVEEEGDIYRYTIDNDNLEYIKDLTPATTPLILVHGYTQIFDITFLNDSILYCTGGTYGEFNINTEDFDLIREVANNPVSFTPAEQDICCTRLVKHKDEYLYASCFGSESVMLLDLQDPENNTKIFDYKLLFSLSTRPIISYQFDCDSTILYISGSFRGINQKIGWHRVDFDTGDLTYSHEMPAFSESAGFRDHIKHYNVPEWEDCQRLIDLDEDDSTTGGYDYLSDSLCISDNIAVSDIDIVITNEEPVDSVLIEILVPDNSVQLVLGSGNYTVDMSGDSKYIIINSGSTTLEELQDAIREARLSVDDNSSKELITVRFTVWYKGISGNEAIATIHLGNSIPKAGDDIEREFCIGDTTLTLDNITASNAEPGGLFYNSRFLELSQIPLYDSTIVDTIYYITGNGICYDTSAIINIVNPLPDFTSVEDQSICYEEEYVADLSTIQDNIMWSDGLENKIRPIDQEGNYIYTIRNIYGCTSMDTFDLIISPEPLSESISEKVCDGGAFTFLGTSYTTAGMYTDTLSTSQLCDSIIYVINIEISEVIDITIDTLLCSGETIQIGNQIFSEPTQDELLLVDSQGCDSIQYVIDIEYKELQEESIDTLLCAGEVFNFMGQTYTESVIDQIVIEDSEGCDSLIINLSLDFEQALLLPDQSFEIPLSNPTQVIIAYDLDYDSLTWFPEDGLSCADCLDPIVDLEQDATYQIEINPLGSCAEFINVQFFVIEEEEVESDFYLPNIISTSDSGNDKFYLQSATDNSMTYSMSIYDRWGSQVFISENINSNDASQGWDGSHYNGAELVQGVYVYKIVFEDGSVVSGDILVLR